MSPYESKEVPVPVAAKVNVLVHPLFNTLKGFYGMNNPDAEEMAYQEERRRKHFFFNVLSHFSPQRPDEFTLVMPQIGDGRDPYDPSVMEEYRDKDFRIEQWPELFSALQLKSKLPHNVILIRDTTDLGVFDGEELFSALRTKGVSVTDKTELTVGGEWLDVCMAHVADQLLSLPYSRGIRINLDATSNTGTYLNMNESLTEVQYVESLIRRGYAVDVADRVVMVRKK